MNVFNSAMPVRVLYSDRRWPVHDVAASRHIEAEALAAHAAHELMTRAGTAVARLVRALAPHAGKVWLACGPGNNGGDGLVAAALLQHAGWQVQVSWLGDEKRLDGDAAQALLAARQCGVPIATDLPPQTADEATAVAVDALLGLGSSRAPQGPIERAVRRINAFAGLRLAVDLPTGLNADTGRNSAGATVRATHTLALLTLKPGLFTADGRDHAGEIWLDTLGVAPRDAPDGMQLACSDDLRAALGQRQHASHKGSFGDVVVVGGAPGMAGAAWLAASAALAAGAGRVFLVHLDPHAPAMNMARPELMLRPLDWLDDHADALARSTVVCGCGGGEAVRNVLPLLLSRCPRLLLDADGLNALATDVSLRRLLDARLPRGQATVLTPHPLEAARLLACSTAELQAGRCSAARELSRRHGCTVLLKGSGSLVAAPQGPLTINPTGNATLASGGTGDVLAGWIGGIWAQLQGEPPVTARQAAIAGAWLHGRAADLHAVGQEHAIALRAADLIELMRHAQRI